VDCAGNCIVSDYGNHSIRCIAPNGTVTTLAGSGSAGFADGAGASAQFKRPWGVAVDREGWIIVADHGNHRIRRISPSGNVSTLAGSGSAGFADGAGASAQFHNPVGVAVDGEGNIIASDWFNHRIRKIVRGGTVSTVAGSGFADGFGDIIGPEGTRLLSVAFQRSYLSAGTSAHFNQPWGVAVDGEGNILVADNGNTRIQRITSSGTVSTCFACSGEFRGLVIDTDGMPVAAFFSP
jgi:sugar lactone lactonase YvrE